MKLLKDWADLTFEEKKRRFQWQYPLATGPIVIGYMLYAHIATEMSALKILLAMLVLIGFGLIIYWWVPHSAEVEKKRRDRP